MSIKLNIKNSSNKSTILAANKFLERLFSHGKRQNNGWYEYRTSTKPFSHSSLILQKKKKTNKQRKKKKTAKNYYNAFWISEKESCFSKNKFNCVAIIKTSSSKFVILPYHLNDLPGVWPFSVGNWYNELLLVYIQLPTIRNPR